MLSVTENAQTLVEGLATEAGLADNGGLRIAMAEDQTQLEVSLAPEPQPGDQVVDAGQSKVFVAEDTAPALENQTLDATQTEQGVGFTLTPQQPTA